MRQNLYKKSPKKFFWLWTLVILMILLFEGLVIKPALAIEGTPDNFFVSSDSGPSMIVARFRGQDYQNVSSCKLSSRSPFIDQLDINPISGLDARYCIWSGDLGSGSNLSNIVLSLKLGAETINWVEPTLYTSNPQITSVTSRGKELDLGAVTLDPKNSDLDLRINIKDSVGLKDCRLSGSTNSIKGIKVYDQFCDISLANQASPSLVTVQVENYFGKISSTRINFVAPPAEISPTTAQSNDRPSEAVASENISPIDTKAIANTSKEIEGSSSVQAIRASNDKPIVDSEEYDEKIPPTTPHPLDVKLISATNGEIVVGDALDKAQISYRKNFFDAIGLTLIMGVFSLFIGVVVFIKPKLLTPRKINSKISPKRLKVIGVGLALLGFGATIHSVALLDNPDIEAKVNPFVDTESTPRTKGDIANLVSGLGNGNIDLSDFPAIKAHYPIVESPDESPSLKTDLQLKVAVAEGIDQQKIFGTEAVITSHANLVKPFIYRMNGDQPSKLFWQVTEGVSFETCTDYKSGTSQYISTELTSGEGSIFNIDFKKVLLPGFLSGQYNGEMSFFVRLVAIGDKGGCDQQKSNVVKLTFKPNSSFQELFNPQASILQLYTTGADQLASQGEFTNQVTESQLDWQTTADQKTYHFGIKELSDMPKYGQWQVSVMPFNNNTCKSPYGIIAYQDIAPNTNPMFTIDFGAVALNQPGNSYIFDQLSPVGNLASTLKKTLYPNSEKSKNGDSNNQSLYDQFIKGKDLVNYYVRFVALDPSNGNCDANYRPSTAVKVSYGPKAQATDVKVPKIEDHYIDITDEAEFKIEKIEFIPVKFQEEKFDPVGHYVYETDVWEAGFWDTGHLAHQKGDKTYIPPNKIKDDKDLWDYVEDVIDSIAEFLKAVYKIMNFVANSYNMIKGELVSQIAKGLTALGAPCEEVCQMVISSGLGIGQTALGMPPSLPNFDQMMDQGVDYLVKEISSQMAGAELPFTQDFVEFTAKKTLGEVRKTISKYLADEAVKQKTPMKPDPDYLYNPAQLKVTIKNIGTKTGSGSIDFRYTENTPGLDVDLATRDLFVPSKLNVPLVNPGESLTIPIVLTENYKDYGNSIKDKSSGVICTKGNQQVDCDGQVVSGTGPLANQKYRWESNYKTASTGTLIINSSHGLSLPSNFDPAKYGFDTSKWKKTSNSFGGVSYYDNINNTYHNFYPKLTSDYSESTKKVITNQPSKPLLLTY